LRDASAMFLNTVEVLVLFEREKQVKLDEPVSMALDEVGVAGAVLVHSSP
jgi:hypothetical protein